MTSIDVNADMGESYGRFSVGQDAELMPYLTSCSIACGFHGGDPLTIERTIAMALENNVLIGAHPSYPDLMGFGRRRMHLPPEEVQAMLKYQISAVKGMVESMGGTLHHVKPHGALNNHMMESPELLNTVISGIRRLDPNLLIYVPFTPDPPSDLNIWLEVFADRSYEKNLQLTPRKIAGSLLDNMEIAKPHLEQLVVHDKIISRQGQEHLVSYQTICIHGDNLAALPIARRIHDIARENGIRMGHEK